MVSELNQTPKSLRLHIGIFGAANAGKSTLVNALSGQEVALTSPVAGTTTDPVFKPMELLPLGPVVLIDTAGLDDNTELGSLRAEKTLSQLEICDCAILAVSSLEENPEAVKKYIGLLTKQKIPVLIAVNQVGGNKLSFSLEEYKLPVVTADFSDKNAVSKIKTALIEAMKNRVEDAPLVGDIVKSGDMVILVAPQDISAPKGRLILPQVQVIRDLLDHHCMALTVTEKELPAALKALSAPPALVITDSQIYKSVAEIVPPEIRLTSFSMLLAKNKGDIKEFIDGARAIDSLKDGDRVLILESCSHHAMDGDIARVKIPALLRKYTGKNLEIVNASGQKLPGLSGFSLAIHCGGCMVSRRAMLKKQESFKEMGIPMTNFGVAIAYMNGILKRVCY